MRTCEKCSHGFCNLVATKHYRRQLVKKALKKALAAQPNLILLDVHLPDMNGVDAARTMKKDQRTAHIPIVGWSAYFGERWREEALRAGMVAYMEKPLSAPVIEATIKQFILPD